MSLSIMLYNYSMYLELLQSEQYIARTDVCILQRNHCVGYDQAYVVTCDILEQVLYKNRPSIWWYVVISGLCLGGKPYVMPFCGLIHPSWVIRSEYLPIAIQTTLSNLIKMYIKLPSKIFNPSLKQLIRFPQANRVLVHQPNPPLSPDCGGIQQSYVKC